MTFKELTRLARVGWEDASYHRRARRMGLVYDEAAVHRRVQAGPLAEALAKGRLRTFAAVRHHNWEAHNLLPALGKLGEVVHFDWGAEGFPPDSKWTREHVRDFNALLLARFEAALKDGPIQLFFGYLTGRNVRPETVRAIRRHGAAAANLCLDDRAKFKGKWKHGAWTGTCSIAAAFDVCWTSTRTACEKYLVEGANPIFLPEGANPGIYHAPAEPVPFDHDVSFVGQCYGMRPKFVAALAERGIRVETFGFGWPNGPIPVEKMVEVYHTSRINLGFGGVGNSALLVCLKGRDFEVPMSGGLYVTQINPELATAYALDREIVCYRGVDDLAEKLHHLLAHPDEADRIRRAGHARAASEHTWDHRFARLLARMVGVEPAAPYAFSNQKQPQP